jgi:hypothetical protein
VPGAADVLAPPQVGPTLFLVGAERSGTTLLRLMLDAHPELSFHHEFELAVDRMPDREGWPELEDYYEFVGNSRHVDTPPVIDRSLDYPALVRSFLDQKRVRDAKPRVGATVHRHYDRLLRIWPDARFIHLVRDGRDVAQSCVGMTWAGNVWFGVERWISAELLWERVARSIPRENRIDVRYEELVVDPVAVLTRICEFIGVSYHPVMLDYPKWSTYRRPKPSLAQRWKLDMKPRDVQRIESRIGEMLVERGYELSGLPRKRPAPWMERALQAQNRVGMAQRRIRKYGLGLWVESLLANRFGPKLWQLAVDRRMHAVINAQLD